jgi:hypothetical protein
MTDQQLVDIRARLGRGEVRPANVAALLAAVHQLRADLARLRQASRARYDLLERLVTHPELLDADQRDALREEIRRVL